MQNSYKPTEERNQQNTCYVGNLDEHVTEALLWELMLQAGPVVNVHLPKDRVTQSHQGFGFAEFQTEDDADYAIKIMHMVKVFGKPLRVNKASDNRQVVDVGANLFIGNLDPEVDEKTLHDTFSAFGVIAQTPKVARDAEVGVSKGYGFVAYDNFESADAAIEAMNGTILDEQTHHSFVCIQEGWARREARFSGRAFTRRTSSEKCAYTYAKQNLCRSADSWCSWNAACSSSKCQFPVGMPPAFPFPTGMMPPQAAANVWISTNAWRDGNGSTHAWISNAASRICSSPNAFWSATRNARHANGIHATTWLLRTIPTTAMATAMILHFSIYLLLSCLGE
ncbi:hypothetical protein BDR26DRAFT_912768 [Obelidium mucronatum]|nr:hypothetical protein BDR26DRAFT_912768 [Obelidium mucronatum]